MTGYVKWFNSTKGFGFIVNAEDRLKEYFVHVSGTLDLIKQDDHVEFQLEENRRGAKAIKVKRIITEDGNR